MSNVKEDAEYYKSKHIIESNNNPNHMDSLALEMIPQEHKERYEQEESKKVLKEVYEGIINAISYYIDMEEDKKKILALWVIGTYFHEEFETFPLLFLNAMRGSAKSRTVRLLTKLSWQGQMIMSITEAGLFRSEGTIGIDEFESLISKEKQTLRELLNSAYKKGTQIIRMKKKKGLEGEEQVAEYFKAYRPIIISNINGIDEVLQDRCITVILEKSNNEIFTKLVEDYDSNPVIQNVLKSLKQIQCSLCSVVTKKNLNNYTNWNDFIKNYTTLHTFNTYKTYTTYTTYTKEEIEIYQKIKEINVNGRNLELYFPLFQLARLIDSSLFNEILEIAQKDTEEKRIEELSESSDITVYRLISGYESNNFIKISDLISTYRIMMGDGNHDWVNSKWLGRALKRLNLVIEKRRTSSGMEVRLNSEKAKDKMEMFK